MTQATYIVREVFAWLLLVAAFWLLAPVLAVFAVGFITTNVPSNPGAEWDIVAIPLLGILAVTLGYNAIRTLFSLRRSATTISIVSVLLFASFLVLATWRLANGA